MLEKYDGELTNAFKSQRGDLIIQECIYTASKLSRIKQHTHELKHTLWHFSEEVNQLVTPNIQRRSIAWGVMAHSSAYVRVGVRVVSSTCCWSKPPQCLLHKQSCLPFLTHTSIRRWIKASESKVYEHFIILTPRSNLRTVLYEKAGVELHFYNRDLWSSFISP